MATKKKSLARGGTKGNPQSSRTASKRRAVSALPKSKAKNAYDLLSEVRALIVAQPKRYDQTKYIVRPDGQHGAHDVARRGFPECGTVGCVAGWVATLTEGSTFDYNNASYIAKCALGLDQEQRTELFSGSAVEGNPQTVAHARLGARHIARFQEKYADQLKAKKLKGRV